MCERLTRCLCTSSLAVILAFAGYFLLASPVLAQNENERIGFSPSHIFEGGGFGENLDTLNGNLTLTIPIGPTYQVNQNLGYQLQLVYNSKIWEYMDLSGTKTKTKLWGESPVGLGFSLTMGRVYRDWTYSGDTSWYFVSPDGNRHNLSWAGCGGGVTFDGTFLTVQSQASCPSSATTITIKNGSGIRYTFDHYVEVPGAPCQNCTNDWRERNAAYGGWHVTLIEDMTSGLPSAEGRYPNWIQIEYESKWDPATGTGIGYGQNIKRITDSLSREIAFSNSWNHVDSWSARTDSIQLPAFANSPAVNNGVRNTYLFHYNWWPALVPIVDLANPPTDANRDKGPVNFLDYVEMPLGFVTRFGWYAGGELYLRTLPMNKTGSLTGPRVVYQYGNYQYYKSFVTGETQYTFGDGITREIEQKKLFLGSPGVESATWTYDRWMPHVGHATPNRVVVTTTQGSPTVSNDTVYYFRGSRAAGAGDPPGAGPNPKDGFAPEWDDGLNYRTEYWVGNSSTGRLLRTEETTYEPDIVGGSHTKYNVRANQQVTTFNDDGGEQLVRNYSEWDQAGHWKVVAESGTGMLVPRVTRTNYIAQGPRKDTYVFKEVTDGSAVLSRSDYAYDCLGRLTTSIDRLTLPVSPGTGANLAPLPGDAVTTYVYDDPDPHPCGGSGTGNDELNTGNVIQKALTDNAIPTAHGYTVHYTYNLSSGQNPYGIGPYLASKRFEGMSWKSIDWQRDGNTGLIRNSCDPAGICTNYSYDVLGRITRIIPSSLEYPTAIRYFDDLRKSEVQQSSNPDVECVGNACILSTYFYDDLARLIRSERRHFDGSTVAQQTNYDALSRVLNQSKWVKLGGSGPVDITTGLAFDPALNLVNGYPSTTYDYTDLISGGQDPFGRAWTVKAADHTSTAPRITETIHRGLSTTVTVKQVNGTLNIPFDSTTTYTKDILGRLVEVSYPTGRMESGLLPLTAAKAEYAYDLKDNLVFVNLVAPDLSSQTRNFVYDGLNRLMREDNPENGTTLYEGYDPLGNLFQKRDSAGNVFAMVYDVAGRLKETRSDSPTGALLARNTYDLSDSICTPTTPDPAIGKLAKVESFADDGTTLQVTQKYCYQGLNGRLSGESTVFPEWSNSGGLKTSYTYNPFGLRERTVYPSEDVGGRTVRDVTATYRNGFQTQLTDTVPGVTHVSDIQYNPAGGIWKIYLPGSNDVINPDPRNRPKDITIKGYPAVGQPLGDLYASGPYGYDGAGNISQIGPNEYRYDPANRLIEAVDHSNDNSITYTLAWMYDPFGNMIRSSLGVGGGSPAFRTFCPTGVFPCTLSNNRIGQMTEGATTDTFAYDVRGNITRDQNSSYDYDRRNRLTSLTGEGQPPNPQGSFVYDAAGQRVKKTVSGFTIYYVRDQEGQVLSEFRKSATSSSPPAWDRDYLYAAGRLVGSAENENPETPPGFKSRGVNGSALLEWQAPPDLDIQGYRVYRRTTPPTWSLIGSPTSPSFTAALDEEGAAWSFKVTSMDTAGHESEPTQVLAVSGFDVMAPTLPSGLVATPGDRKVTVSWNPSTDGVGVLGYEVERNGVVISPTSYAQTSPLVDLGLTNGTTYPYRVRAVDTAGNFSAFTAPVNAVPQDTSPPAPPLGLLAFPGCGTTQTTIHVSWLPNSPDDEVTIYKLYRHDKNGAFNFTQPPLWTSTSTPPETSFDDSNLPVEEEPPFSYVIVARDGAGNQSTPSNETRAALRSGSYDTPLTAFSGDGRVTLKWNGTPSAQCGNPPCSFALYRKWSIDQDCSAFHRVGAVPLDTSAGATNRYAYTDWGLINAVAYDYTLALVDILGHETTLSTLPNSTAMAAPLEPIKDVRRCRVLSSPPTDPCQNSSSADGTWSYRWNPPSTPLYQPLTVSPFDAPQGYLKGYQVYEYYRGCCGQGNDGELQREDQGSPEFGLDAGRDAEFSPDPTELWYRPARCRVVTGVYKIPYNGDWRTLESGWSNNFDAFQPDHNERCPGMYDNVDWCDLPRCDLLSAPPTPGNVTAVAETAPHTIRVSWTKPVYSDLAGYYLYVNDPTWHPTTYWERARSVFRKDHPYLYLSADETSVTLNDLDPCRSYSFYLVSVGGSGRISEPSASTSAIPANPPPGSPLPTPTNLRVRLWTVNDYTYGDGLLDSRGVIRLKWDYACNPSAQFITEKSLDGVTWTVTFAPFTNTTFGFEATMYPSIDPIGTTIYYRVKAKVGTAESAPTEPVAAVVLPYGDPSVSPPANLHARKDCELSGGPLLTWCPNTLEPYDPSQAPEEDVEYYRIFRSTTSGGPYTQIAEVAYAGSEFMPSYVDNDPNLNTTTNWYYYVIQAVRNVGGVITVSGYSRENVAGCVDPIPGGVNYPFDPDSPGFIDTGGAWALRYCHDEYVENRSPREFRATDEPAGELPILATGEDACKVSPMLAAEEISPPAPYRMIGTGPAFRYTYYHLDHLGSPRILTDAAGVRVQGQHFLPFGEEAPVEAGLNSRKFTGHERDSETGLDYMMARYYEAPLGRFLSVDPVNGAPRNPQSWNRYSYVNNNPLNLVDPNGRDDVTPFQLGVEWLTGTGPSERTFNGGDKITQTLAEHSHIESARQLLAAEVSSGNVGVGDTISDNYELDGIQGVPKYAQDYSTLLTGGQTGNLTVTYLGSYELTMTVLYIDERTGEVAAMFVATNYSTLGSATHPPVLGYFSWWQHNVDPWINSIVRLGPGSRTKQTFRWIEYAYVEPEAEPHVDVRCEGADC